MKTALQIYIGFMVGFTISILIDVIHKDVYFVNLIASMIITGGCIAVYRHVYKTRIQDQT